MRPDEGPARLFAIVAAARLPAEASTLTSDNAADTGNVRASQMMDTSPLTVRIDLDAR